MAESYSVKAVLSATDKSFSSTLRSASGAVDSLSSKVKSGFSFGIFAGAGQAAFHAVTNGAQNLVGEINNSNKAWKTFEGNMKILGKGEQEINGVKNTLQKFAQDSIYSSSDMASTYAQLASVGTKSADKLVTGFGGLAAAAENPTQAMKTLSQQAVQMAAKPNVAWADFKLMLEQTPAGMAAVAKQMGMTSSELVSKIQAGEVATEDFFDAINKVGNSSSFQKLATSYKGVDEAMAGLQETLGNKLTPAFDVLSTMAIGGLEKIIGKVSEIDGEALADKVTTGIEKAQPYWEAFKDIAGQVGDVLKTVGSFFLEHSDTIAKCIPYVLALVVAYKGFKFVQSVVPSMVSFASSIASMASGGIKGLAAKLFGVAGGQKAAGSAAATSAKQLLASGAAFLMIGAGVLLIAASFALLAQSAIALSNAGGMAIGVMAGMTVALVGIGIGMAVLLKTLSALGPSVLVAGGAMLMMGAAVLLVAAGFALMAQASISLANAGGLAIGIMVGMVATMALLAVGAAALGPALTAGAVGFIAFGAAIALVGAGALLAGVALQLVAGVLPTVVTYGAQGAIAIGQLGAGMLAFAAGAALAGAAALVLGAGLTVAAVGIAAVGVAIAVLGAGVVVLAAGALVAAAGIVALAAGALLLGTSILVVTAGLAGTSALLPATAAGAMLVASAFAALMGMSAGTGAALLVVSASLLALTGSSAACAVSVAAFGAAMIVAGAGTLILMAALSGVKSSMKSISSSAKSAEKSLKSMNKSVDAVESGLDALGSKAKSAMNKLTNAFDDSVKKAKKAGKEVGTGFTEGMQSGLAKAPNVAKTATASVASSLMAGRASAYSAGAYISQGFAQGMLSQLATIQSAAARMAAAADKAVRAKAKIHSPSRVAEGLGSYWGEGYVNGLLNMVQDAWRAAQELVSIPSVATPNLALAYGGEMSADYDYFRNSEYTIDVPLSIDGKVVARATAKYTQEELDKNQTRESRKHGKR